MTKSKSELQELAKPIFEKLGVNKLYATTDEQFFLLESRARLHAGKAHTVYTLEKDAQVKTSQEDNTPDDSNTPAADNAPAPLSVAKLTEAIAEENDLTKLSNMLLEEVAGANRKSAVAAIEKRIAFVTDLRKEA